MLIESTGTQEVNEANNWVTLEPWTLHYKHNKSSTCHGGCHIMSHSQWWLLTNDTIMFLVIIMPCHAMQCCAVCQSSLWHVYVILWLRGLAYHVLFSMFVQHFIMIILPYIIWLCYLYHILYDNVMSSVILRLCSMLIICHCNKYTERFSWSTMVTMVTMILLWMLTTWTPEINMSIMSCLCLCWCLC